MNFEKCHLFLDLGLTLCLFLYGLIMAKNKQAYSTY